MGISSAAEIFQRALEEALAGLKGVRNLWDDIFVYGREDDGSHDENLKILLERLEEKGLTASTKKAQIRQREVKFFGLIFSKEGIKVSHDKVDAIRQAKAPKNASEAAGLLGLAAFCEKQIPNLATIVKPIRNLTRKGVPFKWGK